jgi:hypothetical protein
MRIFYNFFDLIVNELTVNYLIYFESEFHLRTNQLWQGGLLMFILMATPEASPFARAGNLAEVSYGLSCVLRRSGNRVTVVMISLAWDDLIRNNMALDFSWDSVIPPYRELYRRTREKRRSLGRISDHDSEN